MKVYQLLALSRPTLEALLEAGVNLKDTQHLDMYAEYEEMVLKGEKKMYIEAVLCEKYTLKRAKFYNIIKSFQTDIS